MGRSSTCADVGRGTWDGGMGEDRFARPTPHVPRPRPCSVTIGASGLARGRGAAGAAREAGMRRTMARWRFGVALWSVVTVLALGFGLLPSGAARLMQEEPAGTVIAGDVAG